MQLRHGSEVEGGPEEPPARPSRKPEPRVVAPAPVRSGPKIGRNDPCPCGSGPKFKKCHGAALEDENSAAEDDASA